MVNNIAYKYNVTTTLHQRKILENVLVQLRYKKIKVAKSTKSNETIFPGFIRQNGRLKAVQMSMKRATVVAADGKSYDGQPYASDLLTEIVSLYIYRYCAGRQKYVERLTGITTKQITIKFKKFVSRFRCVFACIFKRLSVNVLRY